MGVGVALVQILTQPPRKNRGEEVWGRVRPAATLKGERESKAKAIKTKCSRATATRTQEEQQQQQQIQNENKQRQHGNTRRRKSQRGNGSEREREEEREADNLLKSCAFYGILSKCYQGSWRGDRWKFEYCVERERKRDGEREVEKDCNLFRKLM